MGDQIIEVRLYVAYLYGEQWVQGIFVVIATEFILAE